MNTNIDLEEKIELYLMNSLSNEEHIAFEEQISKDSELAKKVKFMRRILLAFDQKYEKEAIVAMSKLSTEDMKDLISKLSAEDASREPKPLMNIAAYKNHKILWFSAIAVSFLLLLYIGLQPKYKGDFLFSEYYVVQIYESIPNRGALNLTAEQEQNIKTAFDHYNQVDYAGALSLFEKVVSGMNERETPSEVLFYFSICSLELEKYDQAINKLSFLSSFENPYRIDAEWYLSLSYLKQGKRKQAKQLLKKLIKENDPVFSHRAEQLLDNLNQNKWF